MVIRTGGVLILLAFCVSISFGTIIEKLDVRTLSQKSEFIAIGRIVKVETVLENGEPWTIATVTIEKQMKGVAAKTVQFRSPGGAQKIGNRTLVTQVEGVPLLNTNERAVVFLSGTDKDKFSLVGLARGFWRIQTKDGKEVALSGLHDDAPPIRLDHMVFEIQKAVRERKQ